MSGNYLRKMDPAVLYAQLGRIIETAPKLAEEIPHLKGQYWDLSSDNLLWLGRVEALVTEALGVSGSIEIKTAISMLSRNRVWASKELLRVLYKALAQIELELPTPPSNAFVPAGNSFDALRGIQTIFGHATRRVLIVDPYLDEKFMMEFAQFAPPAVKMSLLTVRATKRPALAAALVSWRKQYKTDRLIELRSATAQGMHDRAVIIDDQRVWTIGQSFNALAARAPTVFVEVDPDTAKLKIAAYQEIWDTAEIVSDPQ